MLVNRAALAMAGYLIVDSSGGDFGSVTVLDAGPNISSITSTDLNGDGEDGKLTTALK